MALYDTIGCDYASFRRPDRRLESAIEAALADASTVVNIGAGAGSYEPRGRAVIAVEPSEVMIRQRPREAAACLRGSAEALPLEAGSVDAAMVILSMHHWTEPERGLREIARVARKRAVILTWVPDSPPFWLTEEYFPEIVRYDRTVFPRSIDLVQTLQRLVGPAVITPVPIPHDCTDGFLCAYWRRPEAYLNSAVRNAISSFARIDAESGLAKLRADLSSGRWEEQHRHLLTLDELDLGYRLVRCEIGAANRG